MENANVKVLRNDVEYLAHEVEDHEERLRVLEKAHWRMTAFVSIAAALFSALGAVAAKFIGG